MLSANQLLESIDRLYKDIVSGEVDLKKAAELNNTIGKLNAHNRNSLEYLSLRKSKNALPFFEPGIVEPTTPAKKVSGRGLRKSSRA